jgi:hypothetical protein
VVVLLKEFATVVERVYKGETVLDATTSLVVVGTGTE